MYGHGGNLGNECADHAAALGTFGLISSHNIATRWVHHNFDANMCFNGCSNIGDILERLHTMRTNAVSLPHDRVQRCFFFIGSSLCLRISRDSLFWCQSLQVLFGEFLLLSRVMDPLSSSASTAPSIDEYFEHNMWNPLLELLFLERATGFVASFLVEIDVAKIALSCHFALDLLCYKEEIPASTQRGSRHH